MVDYREFDQNNISFSPADVTLCMSTTVAKAAQAASIATPVVAIVSDPAHENYPNNFFGISAERSQKGKEYFNNFLETVPSLKDQSKFIHVLNKQNYFPSDEALKAMKLGNPHNARILTVPVTNYNDVAQKILDIDPAKPGGLIILPADWFFAKTLDIINAARAKNLPDFWPVADWVKQDGTGAVAGYGVSQLMSGELLGERIDQYWKNGIPTGANQWLKVPDHVSWVASVSAAQGRQVSLGFAKGLIHV